MPMTRDTGYANYSIDGSNFIPELFSGKLVEKLYAATVFSEIANTEYEGEIKSHGDKVTIRTVPDVAIYDYKVGQSLNYDTMSSNSVELNIDKGKYFNFKIDDVDKFQSDIPLMDKWSTDAGEQMKIKIDREILGDVYADAAAVNTGATAGASSAAVNLGTALANLVVTKANVIDVVVDYGLVLDEQNVPDSGRWAVLPPWMCALIKTSELKDASLAGDTTSIIRNGKIGMIDRFTIYSSNNMNSVAGAFDILFGHKKALTFASQMTKTETLKNPTAFGELVRGLNVYGYSVIDPNALGHSVVARG